ncbi:MAG: PHP domain-containing protein, partial [Eubacteriales bacterium]|nr:PHP domain-containing protein [Eubacteriales bacterium]
MSAGARQKLEKKLLEAMPGCALDLTITYAEPARLLQTDFDGIAAAIAERWLEEAPQLRPFFKAARWSHTGNAVSARVPQAAMHIPGVEAYCKQYTQAAMAVLGLPLTLSLTFDDAPQTDKDTARESRGTPARAVQAAPKKEAKKQPPKAQGKLIYGRTLPKLERALSMRDVQENAGTITVCGTILSMESREKKDGGLILQAVLTDRTGAVPIKLFLDPNEKTVAARVAECQKKGDRLIAHGSYTMDNYLKRMCLLVRDAAVTPAVYRKDAAEEKRVELHLHTKMSSMDALVEPADAVKTAARWGHKAVAITDHGVVQAFPAAVNAANKLKKDGVDIKVILGVEGYLSPDCTLCKWEGKTFVSVAITAAKGLDLPCVFQIAAERFTPEGKIDTFCVCVDTGMPIPADVTRETGLCEADVQDAYVLYDAIRALREFAGDGIWVADAETAFTLCAYCERLEFPPRRAYADALRLFSDCHHEAEKPALTGNAAQKAEKQAALMRTMLLHLKEEGVETLPLFDAIPLEKAKGKRASYHIILLAKNHTGLLNLYRLVSYAHLDHLKKVPRIPKSLLCLYREGIIVGGACEAGEVFRAVLENQPEQTLMDIASFYDYMEIQPIGNNAFLVREERVKDDEGLRDLNRRILALGDTLGKPTVATGDVHFLDPEDAIFRAVLMSARDFKDAEQQAPLYFKTTEEMLDEFSYLGERAREVVIDNPNRIADMCEAMPPFLSEKSTYAPTFPGANDELRGMAEKRAHAIYGDPLPEIVRNRLDKELNSIIGNGYAS